MARPMVAPAIAREHAKSLAKRVRDRDAQVAENFARARPGEVSPLSRLLRGGKGGEVRLKLYLSMLWLAVKFPHDTNVPSRAWAELLGLNDPSKNGARRVADAIVWLEYEGFVDVERNPGFPSKVTLLDDGGSREPYQSWESRKGRYFKLPKEFWVNGWVVTLSGSAVAILLILLDQEQDRIYRKRKDTIWLSPRKAKEVYSLSPDTWTRGGKELSAQGIVKVVRRPVGEEFGWARVRKTYRINMGLPRADAQNGETTDADEE